MDRFRYNAFLREFPFLTDLIGDLDPLDCESIAIKRVDEEVLHKTPFRGITVGSCVDVRDVENVFIITSDGAHKVQAEEYGYSNYAHEGPWHYNGESILEAIDRLGVEDSVTHVAVIHSGYNVRDHCSTADWCCTVYKPARNLDLPALIERETERVRAQVQAEANF